METVKILLQILFIMYWIVLGLLILFKIYTPERPVLAMACISAGVFMALLVFGSVPITEVHIHNHKE